MNRVNRDIVWRLLTTLVVDILNPTLVISLALFVSVGYILTLLMPVTYRDLAGSFLADTDLAFGWAWWCLQDVSGSKTKSVQSPSPGARFCP